MTNNSEFLSKLGSADFESWLLVQTAYKEFASGEDIMESGFNQNSGYVYIALENGVIIASCFGQDVDYIVTDFDNGEEYFLDTYQEAMDKLETIYKFFQ